MILKSDFLLKIVSPFYYHGSAKSSQRNLTQAPQQNNTPQTSSETTIPLLNQMELKAITQIRQTNENQ